MVETPMKLVGCIIMSSALLAVCAATLYSVSRQNKEVKADPAMPKDLILAGILTQILAVIICFGVSGLMFFMALAER